MDLEKFMTDIKELEAERELLAKRVVEVEMENKNAKHSSKELAVALEAHMKINEAMKEEMDVLKDAISAAILALDPGKENTKKETPTSKK